MEDLILLLDIYFGKLKEIIVCSGKWIKVFPIKKKAIHIETSERKLIII